MLEKLNKFGFRYWHMHLTQQFDGKVEHYIRSEGFILPEEQIVKYERAGEGNMNFVVRVQTTLNSVILKQSRPYVEKYRDIPAPIERIWVEKKYYETVAKNEVLASFSPRLLAFEPKFHTMAMEDLGFGSDFLGLYQQKTEFSKEELGELVKYLVTLHSLEISDFPDNSEMKNLNHEHIFQYPFMEDNGFDLDTIQPGLQALAMKYKKDPVLKNKVEKLGSRYLSKGNTLLHGDFYPGSWLKVPSGMKVIDPEFAFMGDAEFDLGVMLAHLKMAALPKTLIKETLGAYKRERPVDENLLQAYAGVEILRRIIGLAQLPLSLSLGEKEDILQEARGMVMG